MHVPTASHLVLCSCAPSFLLFCSPSLDALVPLLIFWHVCFYLFRVFLAPRFLPSSLSKLFMPPQETALASAAHQVPRLRARTRALLSLLLRVRIRQCLHQTHALCPTFGLFPLCRYLSAFLFLVRTLLTFL